MMTLLLTGCRCFVSMVFNIAVAMIPVNGKHRLFKQEAEHLELIRLNIERISQQANSTPVDVFLSYKKTDDATNARTFDADFAQLLYDALVKQGYHVFFAPVTLKNKSGESFEPYIYTAIHSAKAMVVIGTKIEYFNSPWIKNEWGRFLPLAKESNGTKVLIPVCRESDSKHLPKELSEFQTINLSAEGEGNGMIENVVSRLDQAVKLTPFPGNIPKLKSAYYYLNHKYFDKASEKCHEVLSEGTDYPAAYAILLMADLKVNSLESLDNYTEPFSENSYYQKVMEQTDSHFRINLEKIRKRALYNDALKILDNAQTEEEFYRASKLFLSLADYKHKLPGFRY